MRKPGSQTEPELYKPVLRYFCPTSTEPELNRIFKISKSEPELNRII